MLPALLDLQQSTQQAFIQQWYVPPPPSFVAPRSHSLGSPFTARKSWRNTFSIQTSPRSHLPRVTTTCRSRSKASNLQQSMTISSISTGEAPPWLAHHPAGPTGALIAFQERSYPGEQIWIWSIIAEWLQRNCTGWWSHLEWSDLRISTNEVGVKVSHFTGCKYPESTTILSLLLSRSQQHDNLFNCQRRLENKTQELQDLEATIQQMGNDHANDEILKNTWAIFCFLASPFAASPHVFKCSLSDAAEGIGGQSLFRNAYGWFSVLRTER